MLAVYVVCIGMMNGCPFAFFSCALENIGEEKGLSLLV